MKTLKRHSFLAKNLSFVNIQSLNFAFKKYESSFFALDKKRKHHPRLSEETRYQGKERKRQMDFNTNDRVILKYETFKNKIQEYMHVVIKI